MHSSRKARWISADEGGRPRRRGGDPPEAPDLQTAEAAHARSGVAVHRLRAAVPRRVSIPRNYRDYGVPLRRPDQVIRGWIGLQRLDSLQLRWEPGRYRGG